MSEWPSAAVDFVLHLAAVAGPGRMVGVNQVSLDGDYLAHGHDFLEIVLITSGRGIHRTGTRRSDVAAGDVLVLRPGVAHQFLSCAGLEVSNCCVDLGLARRNLPWVRQEPEASWLLFGRLPEGVIAGTLGKGELRRAASLHRELAEALALYRGGRSEIEATAWLTLFLCHLGTSTRWPPRRSELPPPPAVEAAIALLEERPGLAWDLASLGAAVSCHPAHLTRLFGRYLGVSAMAYLDRVRWERAASLLLETNLPVAVVGVRSGWQDPAYFARRFKARSGMTPREYRRRASAAWAGPANPQGHPDRRSDGLRKSIR